MAGDNQTEVEGPVEEDQIRGILIAFVRNGHCISVKNPVYVNSDLVRWLAVCIPCFCRGHKKADGKIRIFWSFTAWVRRKRIDFRRLC